LFAGFALDYRLRLPAATSTLHAVCAAAELLVIVMIINSSAGIPVTKKRARLSRMDGKWSEGLTLVPW